MATTTTATLPAAIAALVAAPHTCYLCGYPAHARYSHAVGTAHYAYVWCGRCGFGQYAGLASL